MLKFLAMCLLVLVAPQVAANEQISEKEKFAEELTSAQILAEMNEEDLNKIISAVNMVYSLDWKGAGTYSFPESHSTLTLPEGYSIVLGEDAKKLNALDNSVEDEALEAIVVRFGKNNICFCNVQSGYIPLESLTEIDPDEQLASFKEAFDKSDFQLEGWALEPYLDVENHVLYYALKINFNNLHAVRIHALKLSSNGYEEIVCYSFDPSYSPLEELVELISKGYSFDPGYRYEDYTPCDKADINE